MAADPMKSDEVTLKHTDSHTDTHTPTHTPRHTPILPTSADTASVSLGVGHEASEEDLDHRFHRRLVGPLPCDSLNARRMSSAYRNRSDRDIPSNAELGDGEIPQHSRDLEGDIKRPYEQPWQRDLRLRQRQRDDWYSDESDQESVSEAVRSGNREPRYYRDGEIPVSRMEIVSSRQPHGEPEVANSQGFPLKTTLQGRSTCDTRRDLEDGSEPDFSTIAARNMEPKNDKQALVQTARLKFPTSDAPERGAGNDANHLFSTIGASERGAEIRVNSISDEQCNHRDVPTPLFSTILCNG